MRSGRDAGEGAIAGGRPHAIHPNEESDERRRCVGGFVGLTWMTGYWATLIPVWVNQVVVVFSR